MKQVYPRLKRSRALPFPLEDILVSGPTEHLFFQGVIDKSLSKQFDDFLISRNIDPDNITESDKKAYEKLYVEEKYPGSSSSPGSMVSVLTSPNPSQTLKVWKFREIEF